LASIINVSSAELFIASMTEGVYVQKIFRHIFDYHDSFSANVVLFYS